MEELVELLDDYQQAIVVRVGAEIDAGCCGTDRDYKVARVAKEMESEIREKLEKRLRKMVNINLSPKYNIQKISP